MKNKVFMMMAMAVVAVAFTSCKVEKSIDAGPIVQREVKVQPFKAIEGRGACDIHFRQADRYRLVVKAGNKIIDDVKTTVDDSVLTVSYHYGDDENEVLVSPHETGDVDIYVEGPELTSVELRGAGDIDIDRLVSTDSFEARLLGVGDLDLNVKVASAELTARGVGDMEGHIDARRTVITATGVGDVDCSVANADKIDIDSRGVGDVDLDVKNCGDVSGRSRGVGDVKVTGAVRSFNVVSSGVGDVKHEG